MGSSDLKRWDMKGQNFLADLHNYACMVWPRMTKFGMIIRVAENHIFRVSAMSLSQGGGAQRPQILGPPDLHPSGLT